METYYLIDFENVHNDGISNIENITKEEHVHIFSTPNATNIRQDIFWLKGDIKSHIVPACKQSLDMHLVSYLGYLIGIHGKQCTYIVISNDRDYDNIINFWKDEGYQNISRMEKLPESVSEQNKSTPSTLITTKNASVQNNQTINNRINTGMSYEFKSDDRSELNCYMQKGLSVKGYERKIVNRICKYVVSHCNDERMLNGIHNDLKNNFSDYSVVYKDVKDVLDKFSNSKSKVAKKGDTGTIIF